MKKLLLCLVFAAAGANAQTIFVENATALTPGNIGTNLDGTVAGQGGWYTTILPAGSTGFDADFKVVNAGGAYGNAVQLTGANISSGSRYMFRDLSAGWASRTSGNDVAELSFDYFTGPVTTSKNTMRVLMYDSPARVKMLGGIMVIVETGEVRGLGYYDNAGAAGNYSFTIGGVPGAPAPQLLAPNTWYRLGVSYNKTTGEYIFKESNNLFNVSIMGAAMGTDVSELDVAATAISAAGAVNTTSGIGIFDNITFKASATSTPLAAKSFNANSFAVSPNPANNFISLRASNGDVFHTATLTDINGRVVAKKNFDNVDSATMDISNIASGMYMMTVDSNNGTITKKIVKN